jgi:hypothetical protein
VKRVQTRENTLVHARERQSIPVATRVTKPMYEAIQSLLNIDAHINLADYIRDLIRRDLVAKGIVFEVEKPRSGEVSDT